MAGPGMETPNELMVVFSNTVTAGFDALSGSVRRGADGRARRRRSRDPGRRWRRRRRRPGRTGRGGQRVVAICGRCRLRGAIFGRRTFLDRRALGRRTAAITGPRTRIGARRAHARSGALCWRRRADLGRCGCPEFSHPGAVGDAAPSTGVVRAASGQGRAPG